MRVVVEAQSHSAWAAVASSRVCCRAAATCRRMRSYSDSWSDPRCVAAAAASPATVVMSPGPGPPRALPSPSENARGSRGDPVPREEFTRTPANNNAGPSAAARSDAGGGGKEDMPGVTEGNTARRLLELGETSARGVMAAAAGVCGANDELGTGVAVAIRAETTGERSVVRGDVPMAAPRLVRRRAEWRALSDVRGVPSGNGSDVCACNKPDACDCEACNRGDVMVTDSACKSGVDMESDKSGTGGESPGRGRGATSTMTSGTAAASAAAAAGDVLSANGAGSRPRPRPGLGA